MNGLKLFFRVTYIRCRINIIHSPDDEHRGARNMQRTGINIYEKRIVRQVGYLEELNRDARSTIHKKKLTDTVIKQTSTPPITTYI